MSAHQQAQDLSPDITFVAAQPFEPKPLIADILRTRFCVPGSVFLVEGVDTVYVSKSERWRMVRLLLGDGELCIQALLSADMHRYVDRGEVAFGSYIKVDQFRVEWRDVTSKAAETPLGVKLKGKDSVGKTQGIGERMVYLVVDDLVLVGWNNRLIDSEAAENEERRSANFEMPVEEPSPKNGDASAAVAANTADRGTPRRDSPNANPVPDPVVEPDEDFEVMSVPAQKVTQNRTNLTVTAGQRGPSNQPSTSYLPWSSKDITKPLKLTKLRSIPNLPYKQNWSVNILAVISTISDIEPSGLPPYTQRRVRLADPSTDKHVLLTVFLDPQQFMPSVGSVVLLLGVKNHMFDGGSLKKYASDRPQEGQRWWYENPNEFSWCDVDGLKLWWQDRQSLSVRSFDRGPSKLGLVQPLPTSED